VQLGANVFRDVFATAQLRQLFNCLKYCDYIETWNEFLQRNT
jgi:hypothetical protein